jgi:predicted nuclease of predicted toxin-antitoxin system
VKFLVDMPLSLELAQWLRTEGHDAVHANELSMNRSPDSEILQAAARGERVVITADFDSRGFWLNLVRPDRG